jgi:capsular exopolysaccharide synthesis family protein
MFDTQELRANTAADVPSGAQAVQLPASPQQQIHLLDRLNAVFRHRRLAAVVFALVVTGMMVQTYSTTPIYQTWARIQIQDERTTQVGNLNANDPAFWQDPEPYYKTQYAVIQSRGLARRVVKKLNLEANPLFNGSAPPPRDPVSLARQARTAASAKFRKLFLSSPAVTPATTPAPDESAMEARLISGFIAGISVQPEQGTRIVRVVYTHSNPQFAALAANTLAEEYAQQNIDVRLENINKTLRWLDDELHRYEQQLTQSEGALTEYREQHNAGSLEEKQNIVVARLNQLNETLTRARNDRVAKESVYQQLKGADPASDDIDNFPVIGANVGVVDAKNALALLQATKASYAGRYGPEHPKQIEINTQIDNARRRLVAERTKVLESIRNDYSATLAQERSFASQLQEQQSAVNDLDKKGGDYKILQRKVDSERAVYQSLLQQQKELSVTANSRANNVQVMDKAEVPGAPILPNPRKDWITAVLAGLTLAIGLAFGIEYLDDTVKTPDDVRRLNLPLLGLVPAVSGERVPILTQAVPHDFGEAFRSLRTSLVFTSGADRTRLIAVTSSQPLEGKTTTAANLAMALALGGSRVLLIDADMRRPGMHKTLGIENNVGLSHILVAQARIRDAVQKTSEPNLIAISAGRTPPNPSELLASDRMNNLLANLRTGPFDWVIIDTPPVLAVTDAVILARQVTGVVFVIGSEMTRRIHSQRALETIQGGHPVSVTAVLNRVNFDRNKYYYSRYYGYQYKSYYGQADQGAA